MKYVSETTGKSVPSGLIMRRDKRRGWRFRQGRDHVRPQKTRMIGIKSRGGTLEERIIYGIVGGKRYYKQKIRRQASELLNY